MLNKKYLMVPGPTPVPERVLNAMNVPMINHRGVAYEGLFKSVVQDLKKVFNTQADILLYPAAGTGAMEASIVNLFSAGDKVLVVSIGVFGDRLAEIATSYGLDVEKLSFEPGQAIAAEKLAMRLQADTNKEIKGILLTHNETSTGVTNDIENVIKVCGQHPALKVVDAVSALGAIPMQMDKWGIDVVFTGSQKALMIPPGIGLVAFGARAWAAYAQSTLPKYYWDAQKVKKSLEKWQNPYTPPVSLIFGLRESLNMIFEEGLENIAKRHELLAKAVRAAVKALGLELLADESVSSSVVTAIKAPANVSAKDIQKHLREVYGITVAGGQKTLEGKIFRIGHLGYASMADVFVVISMLEMTLQTLGVAVNLGAGVKAAQEVFLQAQ